MSPAQRQLWAEAKFASAVFLALGAACSVALLWRPAQIRWHIHQLHEGGAANPSVAVLCEFGADARGPLVNAVHANGAGSTDLLNPAYLALLCLRGREIRDHAGAASPRPDDDALLAMAYAYEHEPSPAYRSHMVERLGDLDVSSRLRLWNRMAKVGPLPPYPHTALPPYPHTALGHPTPCGFESGVSLEPATNRAWCWNVAPVLEAKLLAGESMPQGIEPARAARLLYNRCGRGDYLTTAETNELDPLLNAVYRRRVDQASVLASLTEESDACEWVYRLYRALEIRRPHTAASIEVLGNWTESVSSDCLTERFAPNVEDARDRMRRGLGLRIPPNSDGV